MHKTIERPAAGINYSLRLNGEVKSQSEELYRSLGVPLSVAIQVFLKKSIAVGGFPFEVRRPVSPVPDMATMTGDEFDRELGRGWASMEAGDLVDARDAFARIKQEIQP